MSDIEFAEVLEKRPFEPFRIRVSDNTTYDIRHLEMVMATPTAAYIGIPGKKHRVARVAIVGIEHIVKLLPLEKSGKGLKE